MSKQSKLQTEQKHDIQYRANRELIWGVGFLILANQIGETFIGATLGVLGLVSLGLSAYDNWKLYAK